VAVSLDDVFDREAVSLRVFKIDVDIPLRIDNGGIASGSDQIGSVRQTCQIKLAKIHGGDFTSLGRVELIREPLSRIGTHAGFSELAGDFQHPVQRNARIGCHIRCHGDLIGHPAFYKAFKRP